MSIQLPVIISTSTMHQGQKVDGFISDTVIINKKYN